MFLFLFLILALLSLIFAILIEVCLGVVLVGVILFGTLCFLDLDVCFHSQVREVFSYYVFKYFLSPPSQTPKMEMLVCLMSQRSLKLFIIFLFSFSNFHLSFFQLTDPFLCIFWFLVCFISVMVIFSSVWFFFIFSKSLFNFSVLV